MTEERFNIGDICEFYGGDGIGWEQHEQIRIIDKDIVRDSVYLIQELRNVPIKKSRSKDLIVYWLRMSQSDWRITDKNDKKYYPTIYDELKEILAQE